MNHLLVLRSLSNYKFVLSARLNLALCDLEGLEPSVRVKC